MIRFKLHNLISTTKQHSQHYNLNSLSGLVRRSWNGATPGTRCASRRHPSGTSTSGRRGTSHRTSTRQRNGEWIYIYIYTPFSCNYATSILSWVRVLLREVVELHVPEEVVDVAVRADVHASQVTICQTSQNENQKY